MLINHAKAAGRSFTARNVTDGHFVNNANTFLNKVNSYSPNHRNAADYDKAAQTLGWLLDKWLK